MRIALIEPDIAGNVGTILRLAACFGVPCEIVEPCGFPFSDRALRRSGMDYADAAHVTRHSGWTAFARWIGDSGSRPVLLTTQGGTSLYDAAFRPGDVLMLGSEGHGAPAAAHACAALQLRIPMVPPMRSLNVAVAAGIALGEALRQTGALPRMAP